MLKQKLEPDSDSTKNDRTLEPELLENRFAQALRLWT
jgi:hypothetical protein